MGKETSTVAPVMERRKLRFESIEELMADVDRLEAAQRAGRIRPLGNWDFGTTLNHLATWAEYAFTPCPISAPFFVRWFFRLQKRKLLSQPMRTGARIPRVPGGTLATEPADWEQALPRFRKAMYRIGAEPPTQPSVIFGKMTQRECIDLNLRHSELHLSFLAIVPLDPRNPLNLTAEKWEKAVEETKEHERETDERIRERIEEGRRQRGESPS